MHIAFLHLSKSLSLFWPSIWPNTSQYHQPQTITTHGECELTDGMLLAAPCLPLKQIHHKDLDTAFSHYYTNTHFHPGIAPHISDASPVKHFSQLHTVLCDQGNNNVGDRLFFLAFFRMLFWVVS